MVIDAHVYFELTQDIGSLGRRKPTRSVHPAYNTTSIRCQISEDDIQNKFLEFLSQYTLDTRDS
jgi:hypothetical protein